MLNIEKNIKISWNKILVNYNTIDNTKNNTIDNIVKNNEKLHQEYNNCKLNITIFPKYNDVFKCFNYFEFIETKVVILGQDPYHAPNQATGLCFGINNNVPVPPSLRNIAKELKSDLNIVLQDYTLENWANQGILMLNASLTVIQGKPGSHMYLWSNFTDYILETLNNSENSIIFVAWGAFAYNKLKNIDLNKHSLIVSSHPSPLSVYKKYKDFSSFNGSKPFSKINEFLLKNNKKIIKW
tara:strand:+ start:424 stop:1143 length:720 start_codon:yes stop_codon:yes gene_type:complete